jgi:hypothetical protein
MKDRIKINDAVFAEIVSKNEKQVSGNDNDSKERQGRQSEESDIDSDTYTGNSSDGMVTGSMGSGDSL